MHYLGFNITTKKELPIEPKVGDVGEPIKINWESRHSNQAILLLDNNHQTKITELSSATTKADEYMQVSCTVDFTVLFKDGNKLVISRPLAHILPTQDRKSSARVEYTNEDVRFWQEKGLTFNELFAGVRLPVNEQEILAREQYNTYIEKLKQEISMYLIETHYKDELKYLLMSIEDKNVEATKAEFIQYVNDTVDSTDAEQKDMVRDYFQPQLDLMHEDTYAWIISDFIEQRGNIILDNYTNYTDERVTEFFANPYLTEDGVPKPTLAWATSLAVSFTGHRHPGASTETPSGSGFSGTAQHGASGSA